MLVQVKQITTLGLMHHKGAINSPINALNRLMGN